MAVGDLAAFRRLKLGDLESLIARPGRWATTGHDLQMAGFRLLDDLLRLDGADRPDWLRPALRRFGKLGIAGAFTGTFGDSDYREEVASVLAEMATRMGYFVPSGPVLPEAQHRELVEAVTAAWTDRDVVFDDAMGRLGSPTLSIGGRVVSFASDIGSWLHLDFQQERLTRYDRGAGQEIRELGELLLRDVRLPLEGFDEALVLTNFGRYQRWGAGSWIDQPRHRDDDPSVAVIAASLRAIRAKDPSQRG